MGIYEIYARYSQLYDESKREFIVNSISGRDTAVIKDYENRMKDEMAGIKSEDFYTKDFSLSAMGASPFSNMSAGYYIALIAGYENNWFLTGLSDNFGLWNGFNISAELHIKSKFRFEMQFSRLWSDIKTPGFYYDSDNDYHWDDNKANEMIIRIGAGFEVLSKDKISLIPFAGLQSAEVYQNTSIKDQKGNKIRSNIPDGGGVYLGMDIDYRPKGTYGLRLRVFGSYGSFDKTVNTWSLNTGLTILFPKDF